jgi:hypothetical protein
MQQNRLFIYFSALCLLPSALCSLLSALCLLPYLYGP